MGHNEYTDFVLCDRKYGKNLIMFLAEASLKINTFIDLMFLCDYYRPLSEHLVSMVFSYWRSSAELEDLFS